MCIEAPIAMKFDSSVFCEGRKNNNVTFKWHLIGNTVMQYSDCELWIKAENNAQKVSTNIAIIQNGSA